MSIKTTLVSLLLASSALAPISQAVAGVTVEEMYSKCGIGGAVFKDNDTFAVISNVTWDSGTTAVSSGLSESGCNNSSAKAASLVYKKYAAIEAETASGSGQHLAALMDIYQCNNQSKPVVLKGLRKDFANILSAHSDYDSSSQLDKAIGYSKILDKNVSSSCVI